MNKISSGAAIVRLLDTAEDLANIEHLQAFIDNISHLYPNKEMTTFEWWETYLAWSEVGTEEDMERYYDTE